VRFSPIKFDQVCLFNISENQFYCLFFYNQTEIKIRNLNFFIQSLIGYGENLSDFCGLMVN
jgi:hypothetical protein